MCEQLISTNEVSTNRLFVHIQHLVRVRFLAIPEVKCSCKNKCLATTSHVPLVDKLQPYRERQYEQCRADMHERRISKPAVCPLLFLQETLFLDTGTFATGYRSTISI